MFHRLFKFFFPPQSASPSKFQAFILEPILTPSGIVDIEELFETGDGSDGVGDDLASFPGVPTEFAPSGFESGYFTVGESGEVGIDFLFDSGKYEFELAIFSLEDLDETPGSEAFIQEAARRALTNSSEGYTVIRDRLEGARFDGVLGEGKDWNSGEYKEVKTFKMEAGTQFGIMLVPNGTIEDVYENPNIGGSKAPLFSLSTANPDDALHIGQIADVTGEGNTFVMEDVQESHKWFDRDYNDLIFQVRGATGEAIAMDDVVNPGADWRETQMGEAILDYATAYEESNPVGSLPATSLPDAPIQDRPLLGIIDLGFSPDHPDFDYDNIQTGQDWIDGNETPFIEPNEGNEAGTHRMGIEEIGSDTPLWVGRADADTWNHSLVEFVDTAIASEQPHAVANISIPFLDAEGNTRYELTEMERDAIAYARDNGVILVVAAGDDGGVPSALAQASREFDNIITVGGSEGLERVDYSNFGQGLDILADGGTEENPVISTLGDNAGTMAGTGVAASRLTGAISQVWAANPDLSYLQVIDILGKTARDLGTWGEDGETGSGLLNIAAAVNLAAATNANTYIVDEELEEIEYITGDGGDPSARPSPDPNYLPQNLRFVVDRFYNPSESVSLQGKVKDYDGIADLDRVEFFLQKDGGEWIKVGEKNDFDFDPYTEQAFRFQTDFGRLEPGNYNLQIVPYDSSSIGWEMEMEAFTILSVPEGEELSDRLKTSLERAIDLQSYDPAALSHITAWIVSVQAGQNVEAFAEEFGAINIGATGQIANTYRWEFPRDRSPQDVAKALNVKGIEFAYPLVPLTIDWHSPSDEPYTQDGTQWHLNSGNAYDANILKVWENDILGNGSVIGFVDNGFELDDPGRGLVGHPDLLANYLPELSWDFAENDAIASRMMGKIIRLNQPPQPILEDGLDFGAYGLPPFLVPDGHNYYGLNSDLHETIDRLFVNLDIDHQKVDELDVYLVSPQGTETPLDLDTNGNFSGYLSAFDGEETQGKWVIKVIDNNPNDEAIGRLNDIVLSVNEKVRDHGTKVAGVAIANGENNRWGTGISPEARWAALRMGDTMYGWEIADILYDPYGDRNDEIDIYNNSWGLSFYNTPVHNSHRFQASLVEAAIEAGAKKGRDDLGNIYVFSAGNGAANGSNVNYNILANTRQSIAVAAIDHTGKQATYSESGTPVLVSAFANAGTKDSSDGYANADRPIVTTGQYSNDGDDSNDYTISAYQDGDASKDNLNDFGGTSAAAPFVSGVVALMLEANPALTSRDVQHILIETAQKNDPTDSEWMRNKAGYWVNPKYGFGAVDAFAAVEMAKTWTTVSPEIPVSGDLFEGMVAEWIPDYNASNPQSLKSTVTVTPAEEMKVEWVEVTFNGEHSYLGDLKLVLTSPDGSKSVLSQQHLSEEANKVYNIDQDVFNWTFTSAHHWGESVGGEWTLEVMDEFDGNTMTAHWTDWKINVYGTKVEPPTVTITTNQTTVNENGDPVSITITRTGETDKPLNVSLDIAGSAVNGDDFEALPETVEIPAGQSSITIPLIPKDDSVYEGEETIAIALSDGIGYKSGEDNAIAFNLIDNDELPELPKVALIPGFTTITESNGETVFTIVRNSPDGFDQDVTVNYAISGTASNSEDYESLTGSVTLKANQFFVQVPIKAIDDSEFEGDETVVINLANWTGYEGDTNASYTVNIVDDDIAYKVGYDWTWTYFGEDFNPNGNDAILTNTPNSDQARNEFLANLENVKIENFESYADASVPTTLKFGDETATVSGIRSIRDFSTGGYNGDGTYPISGDKYMFHYAESKTIKIDFENPQSAFGFSTTDAGDINSQVIVTLHREDGTTEDLIVPHGQGSSNWGEATFFGVTDLENPFVAVTLTNTNQYDGFGIDDLIIGDIKPETILNTATPPNQTLHLAYREDTPLNLSNILVTDPDGEATVKLTLSRPTEGSLAPATSGNVTSTYDPVTGIWQASGEIADINRLLADLEFTPRNNAHGALNIATEITVGDTTHTGSIALTGIPINDRPTLTAIAPLTGAKEGQPFTLTYEDLLAASDAKDIDNTELDLQILTPSNGTLTRDGLPVASETPLNPGETLTWTPDTSGDRIPAFRVKAFDGELYSENEVEVAIAVTPNNTPTLVVEPTQQWVRQLGSNSFDSVRDVATDSEGNVFLTGWVRGDIDGNTYAGRSNIGGGSGDGVLTKYDPAGNKLWTTTLGSISDDAFNGVTTDSQGNAYVVGSTLDSLDGHNNLGSADAFFAKYDRDGNLVWSKQPGTDQHDKFSSIVSDSDDNLYTVGATAGIMEGTNSYYGHDALIQKWDNDGNLLWTKQFASTASSSSEATDVVLDEETGDIFITGYAVGTLDGETGLGSHDVMVARYDKDGNMIWQRQFGTTESDVARAIDLDSDGNVYVSGMVSEALEGETFEGFRDAFAAKLDKDGNLIWTEQFGQNGSNDPSRQSDDHSYGIGVDANNQVYVTGHIGGSLDNNEHAGSIDAFITGLDTDGNRSWSQQFGFPSWDTLRQIDFDDDNNMFVAGTVAGEMEGQTYVGSLDLMVAKYNHTQTYFANTPFDLNGIYVNDTEGDTVTVTLTLSDANAGILTSTTTNDASTDFTNGVLTVKGSTEDVNAVLKDLQFKPATDYTETVTIKTSVSDPYNNPVTGATLTLEGTQPPQFFTPDTPYLSFAHSPFSSSGEAMKSVIHTASYNGHTYHLLNTDGTKWWLDAEEEAIALGGHLVTINDAAENQWVWETFAPIASDYAQTNDLPDRDMISLWLGLSDRTTEGQYQWSSGESSGYSNWLFNQPENRFEDEDFVGMLASTGKWHDLVGSNRFVDLPFGVVEVENEVSPDPGNGKKFKYFHIENFEDGQLNTPGLSISQGQVIKSGGVDSVDGDDGLIDGSGSNGQSWHTGNGEGFTITFDPQILGQLPTHAGFALTDLGRTNPNLGSGKVIFEALDVNGESLGTETIQYGDNNWYGGTNEDRFLGVAYEEGISGFKISFPDGDWGVEIDHIQYGVAGENNTPTLQVEPTQQWLKQFGTDQHDQAVDIINDRDSNFYILGETRGDLEGNNAGQQDAFLAKYDSEGNQIWTQQFGGAENEWMRQLASDRDGNIYIAGSTGSQSWDRHTLVAKFDDNGQQIWQQTFDSIGDDAAFQLTTDDTGHVYVAGQVKDSLNGQPNAGKHDAYVVKLDSTGNNVWTKQFGTEGKDAVDGISIDPQGNIYVGGTVWNSPDGDTSQEIRDGFIRKYDPDGNEIWPTQLGTPEDDILHELKSDREGNIYIAGVTKGNLAGEHQGNWDAFVMKYDSNGDRIWAQQLGTSGHDGGAYYRDGLGIDSQGNVYFAGGTQGDLGGENAGSHDAFIVGFDKDGNLNWNQQFGTVGSDSITGLTVNDDGSIGVVGWAQNTLADQPNSGGNDAILAKYDFTQTYIENIPLDLNGIFVNDADAEDTLTVTLTLSDANAGILTSTTTNDASMTFNAGVLTVEGSTEDVNAILADLQFNPATNYNQDVTIATTVTDGRSNLIQGQTITLNYLNPTIVTNTNDRGIGSLRYALEWSNQHNPGLDTITFDIPITDIGYNPNAKTFTIQPLSALPEIQDPAILNATTQPGFNNTPIIEIDGSLAGDGADGFTIATSDTTIRGFVINRFDDNAIAFRNGQNSTIVGNYLGTDVTGTVDLGNQGSGIRGQGSGNIIGGMNAGDRNLISGNEDGGVYVSMANTQVINNYIGTDITGTQDLGNAFGVRFHHGFNNLLQNNLISGNDSHGAWIDGGESHNNIVRGNFIGTNADGTAAIANGRYGININGHNGSRNHIIGGTTPEAGNLISGNLGSGINIQNSSGNIVQGNEIDTNAGLGVRLFADNNAIGGLNAGEGNIISGNGADGIYMAGSDNNISGNAIEGNGDDGIQIGQDEGPANNNTVTGNAIAFNNGRGIFLSQGTENEFSENSIHDNNGKGILFKPGYNTNESQPAPTLTHAVSNGTTTAIEGTLNADPNTTYRVEFFSDKDGEGKTFLGSQNVTTDGNGNASVANNFPNVAIGEFITATATDPTGNTSMFAAIAVQGETPNNAPNLTNIDAIQGVVGNQPFTMTYEDLLAASNATDSDGDEISFIVQSANVGTLTKDGQPIVEGVTTLSPGEFLVGEYSENDFRQSTNFSLPAFSVTATDGVQESQTPVDVTLNSEVYLTQPLINQFSLSTSNDLTLSIKGMFPNSGWTLNPITQELNGDTFYVEVTALAPYTSSGGQEEFSKEIVLALDLPQTNNYSYKAVINDTSSVRRTSQVSSSSSTFISINNGSTNSSENQNSSVNTNSIFNMNNLFDFNNLFSSIFGR
ncbi:MAG: S8 family serine peptidase [Cyanobacteria bacterium P01_E01_bin.42]